MGYLKAVKYFQLLSNNVIEGMLADGVIIILKQIPHALVTIRFYWGCHFTA
jgi:MFS superfamily sulfate permease-like transporter